MKYTGINVLYDKWKKFLRATFMKLCSCYFDTNDQSIILFYWCYHWGSIQRFSFLLTLFTRRVEERYASSSSQLIIYNEHFDECKRSCWRFFCIMWWYVLHKNKLLQSLSRKTTCPDKESDHAFSYLIELH